MKIKVNLKTILVVLTIVTLFVVPTYVFAAEDFNDFGIDTLIKFNNFILFKPNASGVPVPGAKLGSFASISYDK